MYMALKQIPETFMLSIFDPDDCFIIMYTDKKNFKR